MCAPAQSVWVGHQGVFGCGSHVVSSKPRTVLFIGCCATDKGRCYAGRIYIYYFYVGSPTQ